MGQEASSILVIWLMFSECYTNRCLCILFFSFFLNYTYFHIFLSQSLKVCFQLNIFIYILIDLELPTLCSYTPRFTWFGNFLALLRTLSGQFVRLRAKTAG